MVNKGALLLQNRVAPVRAFSLLLHQLTKTGQARFDYPRLECRELETRASRFIATRKNVAFLVV
jgi:hypothetical protein